MAIFYESGHYAEAHRQIEIRLEIYWEHLFQAQRKRANGGQIEEPLC